MKKERLSNFDLLKIVSMLFIILGHILLHGNVLNNTIGTTNMLLTFIMLILMVHVNSFVLVTGFFQYKKTFKMSKLVQLNNAMWFYKVFIMIIFLVFGITKLTNIEIFQTILPINYDDYWFISTYLLLYISTPLLNLIIKNINKKQHKLTIITMLLIISVLSTITNQVAYNNNYGYSLSNFIMLYFIGSYISKYNIRVFKELDKKTLRLILILIILLSSALNLFIFSLLNTIQDKSEFIKYIADIAINARYSYCNPLIIISSISYFLLFKTFNIKNKIITYISTLTFGVYLIHDNKLIRKVLYNSILNIPLETIHTNIIIPKIIIYTLLIFLVCSIIELIRKYIFKYIYNKKLSKIIRVKISKVFKKYNIDW